MNNREILSVIVPILRDCVVLSDIPLHEKNRAINDLNRAYEDLNDSQERNHKVEMDKYVIVEEMRNDLENMLENLKEIKNQKEIKNKEHHGKERKRLNSIIFHLGEARDRMVIALEEMVEPDGMKF
jgi:hypothetical protein